MTLDTAELILAEVHQQLLIKQENHSLNRIDEYWLQATHDVYGKRQADIDQVKIKQSIGIARLTGTEYVSTITGKVLSSEIVSSAMNEVQMVHYLQKKLDREK